MCVVMHRPHAHYTSALNDTMVQAYLGFEVGGTVLNCAWAKKRLTIYVHVQVACGLVNIIYSRHGWMLHNIHYCYIQAPVRRIFERGVTCSIGKRACALNWC